MSTKHVILGVLMQCPGHGYHIKKLFAPFISKNGLNDGQVYPMLNRLERDKFVRKEVVHQEKTPSKNIYHITESGREEFLRWLTGPDDESDPVRYDFFMQYRFLMKCNFLEHLSRDERIEKLRTQIKEAEDKIAEYESVREDMQSRGLGKYKLKIVDFGIETQHLKIRWCGDLLEDELREEASEIEAAETEPAIARKRKRAATKKGRHHV